MRTAPQAIAYYNAKRTNIPGACQHETWVAYQSHAVGDVDGDGDADAVDGWLSEPKKARHTDRHPMIGSAVAWAGGSKGHGHRAIVVGYEGSTPMVRSTDAAGEGHMGTVPLSWFEDHWHLHYLGWTETISGEWIKGLWFPKPAHKPAPDKETPVPKPKITRGPKIDHAIKDVSGAKAPRGSDRSKRIKAALNALLAIKPI